LLIQSVADKNRISQIIDTIVVTATSDDTKKEAQPSLGSFCRPKAQSGLCLRAFRPHDKAFFSPEDEIISHLDLPKRI
jgi:hypothetical protein